ncbi:AraC family transcriptional regulator [Alkalicaulis satelles]|uniref:AraC family transcriptional regulator n=1 Tax=Alkalicaulis satelles TaxID=2609175 RepID=A0A5M6ZK23_9PROT|nr:AraC family transcriptional regulator [Alkalicaulis satelles]KAA5803578.1 AraC family transcriptional regulator [Alkalicaulis satelles]
MKRSLLARILWQIESAGEKKLRVSDIAKENGISVFHLTRVFTIKTGSSPARFLRMRRLTQAAYRLTGTDKSIVEIALRAGYGSQEAFTRAFSAAFAVTPAAVGKGAAIPKHLIQESITLPNTETYTPLMPPRFELIKARRIVGLSARYSFETNGAIPAQWVEFITRAEAEGLTLAGQSFGVCHGMTEDGTFSYLAGVEADTHTIPKGFSCVTIQEGRYAVFTHFGSAATLRDTVEVIWNRYLPQARFQNTGAPDFELYPAEYNPTDPKGKVEIWIPIVDVENP